MIKEKNFRKCDSVSSASSRRALEHIVPGGHREVHQWDRVRVNWRSEMIAEMHLISLSFLKISMYYREVDLHIQIYTDFQKRQCETKCAIIFFL